MPRSSRQPAVAPTLFTLGVEVRAALAATHGQGGQAVLENLWREDEEGRCLGQGQARLRCKLAACCWCAAGTMMAMPSQQAPGSHLPSRAPWHRPLCSNTFLTSYLLKAEELEDAHVHRGVETEAALQMQSTGHARRAGTGEWGGSGWTTHNIPKLSGPPPGSSCHHR